MDRHERTAVERRLSEIDAAIGAIPKNSPRRENLDRWNALLEEEERLQSQLKGSQEAAAVAIELYHHFAPRP